MDLAELGMAILCPVIGWCLCMCLASKLLKLLLDSEDILRASPMANINRGLNNVRFESDPAQVIDNDINEVFDFI